MSQSRTILRRCLLPLLTLGALALLLPQAVLAQKYTFVDLGALPGDNQTFATGINNSGQIVGGSYNAQGLIHAVLYNSGGLHDLGGFGGSSSVALAINSSGQVVGRSNNAQGVSRAFLYGSGGLHDLNFPGTGDSQAKAINASGQVVGFTTNGPYDQNAYLYSGGKLQKLAGFDGVPNGINDSGTVVGRAKFTDPTTGNAVFHAVYYDGAVHDLGTFGGTDSTATAINVNGEIVGMADVNAQQSHAFSYENGIMTDLGSLGGDRSGAGAVNKYGEIVGTSLTGSGVSHAFVFKDGTMTDLNALFPYRGAGKGYTLEEAVGINDHGQIIGEALSPSGQQHGYLLNPIPEFSSCAGLGLFLLGGLSLMARRRPRRPGQPTA